MREMSNESEIQSNIILYLTAIGCKVINTVSLSKSGNADLVICYKGFYVEIEVKDVNKNARKLQVLKGKETTDAEGFWFVAHSVEEVKEAIEFVNQVKGLV